MARTSLAGLATATVVGAGLVGVAPPGGAAVTTYELTPGHARTYNEGALHSPWREGPAKMIRIEGGPIGREGQAEYEIV